jgi:DNA-binding LytR/AlgR family response regulator
MKVLIIEDEKLAAERLKHLLEKEFDASILGSAASIKSAVKWISENPVPELIFMDIQLADGLSFEIFEQVEVPAPVIFTTAFDEYALKAFKVNSIDYLLKPVDRENLHRAIEKYKRLVGSHTSHAEKNAGYISQLEQFLKTSSRKYKNRFVVKIGEHLQFIPIENIDCFYSMEKATFIYRDDKRNLPVDFTMDKLEELLDPEKFFRVSRKFIIRLDSIKDVISYSNSRLKILLKNSEPEEIIVARERVGEFKGWMEGN